MTVIAIFNQKGGVGKTTITANLAAAIARNGIEPLVIDLDPQAHLTALWQQQPPPEKSISAFYRNKAALTDLAIPISGGVRFIPGHIDLARVDVMPSRQQANIRRLKKAFDQEMISEMPVIIDCSPMLGVLAFSALFAADIIMAPVAAEYLALNGARILTQTLNGIEPVSGRKHRRYLINRYVPGRKTVEDVVATLKDTYPGEVLRTRIHENEALVEAIGWGQDVFNFSPESNASDDFSYLLDELVETGLLRLNRA